MVFTQWTEDIYVLGLSDSENSTITIVETVIFTIMNSITIVGLCGFVQYINS